MILMQDSDSKFGHQTGKIQLLLDRVLNSRGHSDPELRRAVEHKAATHAGRLPEGGPRLPQELSNYVDKVARNAFKVTDGDIKDLRDAGYSEDAIFELTLCAALGAGIARLDRAMTAMKGDDNALKKY
jgi:alkylhydroperoxidase family enzyme